MTIRSPNRISHRGLLNIAAAPDVVFPLLCPVAESQWADGWKPALVLSHSGKIERDCVFVTGSAPDDATWIVSRHDPISYQLEMFKFTPSHSVGRLEIAIGDADVERPACVMAVTTTYTSVGPRGDAFIQSFTEARYVDSMRHWEKALNHYISTGEKL